MDETAVARYIVDTFEGVETVTKDGDTFFFYGAERMFPFATLVTNNAYDDGSALDRPGVYRLNIGVGKQTFRGLFGEAPAAEDYDFAGLDRVMPHPTYGKMYWLCVLNPGATTFEQQVRPLLAEAYERDVAKQTKRAAQS